MAFITSPAIFRILDGGGGIVSGNARVLQFAGEVSLVETSPGVVLITVGGPGSLDPNRIVYTGPDGDIKVEDGFSYNEAFNSFYGGGVSGEAPLFFSAFAWGTNAAATKNSAVAIGFNVVCDILAGIAVGQFNEIIPGSLVGNPDDPEFQVGIGDNPGDRRDGLRIYKGGRCQTLGSRRQRIRTVSTNTTLSLHTDRYVFVDTTAAAINITLPVGLEGMEYHIKNIGAIGGNPVNLIASGGNTLEVATISNTTVETCYHLVFSGNRWSVVSRFE